MKLDEAIRQCEEIADYDCYNDDQRRRAKSYKQLAEWLRDYKRLLDWTELMVICDNCGHAIHVKRMDVKPITSDTISR